MDTTMVTLDFDRARIGPDLGGASSGDLDEADFGVIGFDSGGVVRLYNRFESEAAGLTPSRVLGRPLFTEVAPCMNNFMVAQRFAEAAARGVALDATIDYVLTLRMRPTRVRLRLVAEPAAAFSYVLVQRKLGVEPREGLRGAP